MNEDQRAFWSAIAQIVPVILLAMAVEEGLVGANRRQVAKFWQAEINRLSTLRKERQVGRIAIGLLQSFGSTYGFMSRFMFAPVVVLVTGVLLLFSEVAALVVLLGGNESGGGLAAVAILAVLLGAFEVALIPVGQRVFGALAVAFPRPSDLRPPERPASQNGTSEKDSP